MVTRGHTLPELLVGLAVGLCVILAAVASYTMSRQSWISFDALDLMQHNAQVAMRHLRTQARASGSAFLSASPDGLHVQRSPAHDPAQPDLWGTVGTRSDTLSLGHWRGLGADDCQGNRSGSDALVLNHYQLNSKRELTCKDLRLGGGTYQALAEGVEDFQVRYAQSLANQQVQWVTAAQVSDMTQVLAIEVCLRWVSPQSSASRTPSTVGCQGETVAADGWHRRVQRRVMALRHHAGVLP